MRRFCVLSVCSSLAMVGLIEGTQAARAASQKEEGGKVAIDFEVGAPRFSLTSAGTMDIAIDGLMNTIDAGLPSVPVKTMRIALPQGTTFDHVELIEGSHERRAGELSLAASQVPLSWRGQPPRAANKASAPDFKGTLYPFSRTSVNVQVLHGVEIVLVNIYPILWDRGQKTIDILQGGSLAVYFRSARTTAKSLLPHQQDQIQRFVDNPDTLLTYDIQRDASPGAYDYLIISNSTFIGFSGDWDLKAFQNGLATRGLVSKITNISDINASGTGADLIEKVRNFIRSEYQQYGIKYVLLAADGDKSGGDGMIPVRRLWSKVNAYLGGNWQWEEQDIPADLYYSCLDGTFNGNGNQKWGEPGDGEGGRDVDLLAEVTVGRWSMKTTADLQNMVRKTLWISSNRVPKKALLAGEELFAEMDLYGDEYMEQLVGQCTDHKFETNGFSPDWTIERLYDRQSSWTGSQALSKVNGGNFAMINHLGHSNQTYNLRLSSTFSTPAWNAATPFLYYTQGCFPGDFTYNDSFIEKLVRHPKGAVAAIANTNYGLGPEDPDPASTKTPGASNMLNRRFVNAIFSEHEPHLGRAHAISKEEFIGLASSQEIRWVMWDANFFGDPSIELHY